MRRLRVAGFWSDRIGRGAAQFRDFVSHGQRDEAVLEFDEGARHSRGLVRRRHHRLQHARPLLKLRFALKISSTRGGYKITSFLDFKTLTRRRPIKPNLANFRL